MTRRAKAAKRALFGPARRIHWSAVGSALLTIAGIVTSSGFIAALPERFKPYGPWLAFAGVALAAYTKPVKRVPPPAAGGADA